MTEKPFDKDRECYIKEVFYGPPVKRVYSVFRGKKVLKVFRTYREADDFIFGENEK